MSDSALQLQSPPRPRVLIVDDSRMVRAVLAKHIHEKYDVREESDGEAAWQTLMFDPTIQVVITDLSMPNLDGYGLLDRIRGSQLTRIRDLSVIVISGLDDEAARNRAKECGATDFITKSTGTIELLSRVDALFRLSQTSRELDESREVIATTGAVDPASGLMTRSNLERQCVQVLSYARRYQGEVSALLIGFDKFDELVSKHGEALGEQLIAQFAKTLQKAVRREDSLARYDASKFVIVAPSATFKSSAGFAFRLREAIGSAQVVYRGETLRFSLSIGISNSVADNTFTSEDLLGIAYQRLEYAQTSGGNCVVSESTAASAPVALTVTTSPEVTTSARALNAMPTLEQALAMIKAGEIAALKPHLTALEMKILPLVKLFKTERKERS